MGEKHKPGPPFPSQLLGSAAGEASGSSSIGNLLMNIQGLLKVAVDNARHHEQQTNYEKGQLTMLIHVPVVVFYPTWLIGYITMTVRRM